MIKLTYSKKRQLETWLRKARSMITEQKLKQEEAAILASSALGFEVTKGHLRGLHNTGAVVVAGWKRNSATSRKQPNSSASSNEPMKHDVLLLADCILEMEDLLSSVKVFKLKAMIARLSRE